MCCFSRGEAAAGFLSKLFGGGPAVKVSDTQIFARVEGSSQALVYSMKVALRGATAMILPLPIRPGSDEDAVGFVDLSGYADFFDDLEKGFPEPVPRSKSFGLMPQSHARQPLKVHTVGSFEASFVPTVGDFDRLDERFRFDDGVWDQLPAYRDHGFAVFKLQAGGEKRIHPMAFRFPTRDPDRLFFPTLHVHDGKVHEQATFSHSLYYQRPADANARSVDRSSELIAGSFVKVASARDLVDGGALVYRRQLSGKLPNADTWI